MLISAKGVKSDH